MMSPSHTDVTSKLPFLVLIGLFAVVACGSSSNAPSGPTAATVSVQPADVPSGMKRCDLTGDINSFIAKEPTPAPDAAKTAGQEWQAAKKSGATAAYAAFYTDSAAHCTSIESSGADPSTATYKLVMNFVVQYRDENTAAGAYRGEDTILGFNPNQLRGAGAVVEGTQTGLSDNSIALTQPVGDQLFYIAIWQNRSFVVILVILNLDANAAKKVAVRENSRIK